MDGDTEPNQRPGQRAERCVSAGHQGLPQMHSEELQGEAEIKVEAYSCALWPAQHSAITIRYSSAQTCKVKFH